MTQPRSLSSSFQQMRSILITRDAAELTDAELVYRFAACRDDAAFSALVRRYGILVLGVCRRVLRHEQDAEDAFQATFLILAQKATRIQRIEQLGNWLYGVAYNVSRKAKAYRHRHSRSRNWKRHQVNHRSTILICGTGFKRYSIRSCMRLADKYRTPIVLCDLRGLTIQEAAAQVGCPQKTLSTRLSRGRAILASRLTKRGVAISVGALAASFSSNATSGASVSISPHLVERTSRLARDFLSDPAVALSPELTALTRGVSNVMASKSLKIRRCIVDLRLDPVSSGLVKHLSATTAVSPSDRITVSDRSAVTPVKKRKNTSAKQRPSRAIQTTFIAITFLDRSWREALGWHTWLPPRREKKRQGEARSNGVFGLAKMENSRSNSISPRRARSKLRSCMETRAERSLASIRLRRMVS